jgi:beta-glucanase (GH16 family)
MKNNAMLRYGVAAALSVPLLCFAGLHSSAPFPASDPDNKGNWLLYEAMSDEFNGNTLNHAKWKTQLTGWQGRPPALIVDRNVEVGKGMVRITMRKEPIGRDEAAAGYRDYTTGAIQSTTNVLYGYFEIRARAMKSGGSSAFWFPARDERNWNELDVFEAGGAPPADPKRVFMSGHVFLEDGLPRKQNSTTFAQMNAEVADAFHVYGMRWSPDTIDFYIDGKLKHHMSNNHWHSAAAMVMDAETQADWWGMPHDADLPSVYEIDYVRAWKQTYRSMSVQH